MSGTNVDNQEVEGAGGTTNPPASQTTGTPVAVDADTLSKLVRETIASELKPIKGEISGIYSRQDKDRNSMREFMDEVKKQQAKGLTENDAIDAAQNVLTERAETVKEKQMLKEIHAKLFGESSAQPAGNGASGAGEAAQYINSYNLDANDPEVIGVMSLKGDALRASLADIAYRRATKQPPSASAAPAGNVPVPVSAPDEDRIYAEIAELSKNYTFNKDKIMALQKRLGK